MSKLTKLYTLNMCVNYSLLKLRTFNLFDAINSLLLNCFKCDNDYTLKKNPL